MAQYRNQGDKYVNTTLPVGVGTGTSTDPYSRISQAISALGTAGGTIVITGGLAIQEDCTKLYSGVARTNLNSNALTFVFDSSAYTDCSQPTYFKVISCDNVKNMQWVNGVGTKSPYTYTATIPNTFTATDCVFDDMYFAGTASPSYVYNFVRCALHKCSGFNNLIFIVENTVIYKHGTTQKISIAKNSYFTQLEDGNSLSTIPITTNNGGNTCESGAILGATPVGDPQFIDPAGLNFLVLPTSPLVGAGAFDILSGRQADSGLGLSTYKYNGLSSVFQKSNGAVYSQTLGVDDVVVDPASGLFSLTPGKMRGKVKSGLMDKGKKSITKNIGGRRLTTYTDLTMPDYFICCHQAPHKAVCSGTAADNTHIVLSTHAVADDDYYNGMVLTITAGSGTAGRYTIVDYVGATRTATLATSTGTITDATTYYNVQQVGNIMFDFEHRYGDTVTAINAAAYQSQEWQAQPMINGGLGAADPGYNSAGSMGIDCRIEQLELCINKYSFI